MENEHEFGLMMMIMPFMTTLLDHDDDCGTDNHDDDAAQCIG